MKKWILVLLLYGLGTLLLYDVTRGSEWIRLLVDSIFQYDNPSTFVVYSLVPMILILLVLMNYFILRIRANNPAFTFINAMFLSLLFILLAVRIAAGIGANTLPGVFERIVDAETWNYLWTVYKVVFVVCVINIISGIVISEAKTKKAYLTAEFIYLLTGLSLALLSARFIF